MTTTSVGETSPAASPTVGIMLPRDIAPGELVPFARRAEQLGFPEIWVVEDCFFRGGIAQAAVVLASTSRITVGIGIVPAAARNVAFLTLEVGTLAELYPGRLHVGVGHGMPVWMRQVGAQPASPLTMLGETFAAMHALLSGDTVTVAGRYVSLDAVALDSPPAVVPPLLAGVRGPKSLALAGESADGTILAEPVTPEYLAAAREQIAATRPHRIVAYNVAVINTDPAIARTLARTAMATFGEPDWAPHIVPLPFADEFAALRSASASAENFAQRMPDAWIDTLALVGTPERVRARIAELAAAGADSSVLIPVGEPMAALESLAAALPGRE